MSATSKAIKQTLGLFLIAIGLLVVTGLDRSLEAGLVDSAVVDEHYDSLLRVAG
jgi:hypothetical protein